MISSYTNTIIRESRSPVQVGTIKNSEVHRMKKYLSKTYLVGVIALTLAFGLQSFQKAQVSKKAETTQTMVWFPASSQNQTNCNPANFDTDNGRTTNSVLCNEGITYCCAIGYPIEECNHLGDGLYELRSDATSTGVVLKYDPE